MIRDMEYSIIANSGIQLFTFPLEIDLKQNFKRWFHEWYDKEEGIHKLDLVECVHSDDGDTYFYNKKELIDKGYLTAFETQQKVNPDEVREDGLVHPLAINNEGDDYLLDEIFSMSFDDSQNKLSFYENKWIPLPYFRRRVPALQFDFGAFNWTRVKFVPKTKKMASDIIMYCLHSIHVQTIKRLPCLRLLFFQTVFKTNLYFSYVQTRCC